LAVELVEITGDFIGGFIDITEVGGEGLGDGTGSSSRLKTICEKTRVKITATPAAFNRRFCKRHILMGSMLKT
jgi:hypothetical protein